jgi:FtsZ-binding cell division protein ZapB
MSKLSERVEERKQEAQALADKFNTAKTNIDKLQEENAQVYEEFKMKNYQYKELLEMLQEEEGVKVSTGKETSSEVVE